MKEAFFETIYMQANVHVSLRFSDPTQIQSKICYIYHQKEWY